MSQYENTKAVDELMTTLGVSIADLEVLCHVERFTDEEEGWKSFAPLSEVFEAAKEGCDFRGADYAWGLANDTIYDALTEKNLIEHIEADED